MARPERAEPADLRKGRRGLLDPSIPLDARPALDEDLSGPHHLTDHGSRDDQARSWLTLAASWAGPRPAAPARRACIELVKAGQTRRIAWRWWVNWVCCGEVSDPDAVSVWVASRFRMS